MIYPENALILAPLAGYTDIPFRQSMRRHGATFAFTEMIDAESLIYAFDRNERNIAFYPGETHLGLQLVSAIPEACEKAIDLVRNYPFYCIDFNLGCPAPKVAKKGEGAKLARENPELALKCMSALSKAAKNDFPITVKTRILSEDDPFKTVEFCKQLESAGAQALTLHGRIMEKFYSGPCFADIIRLVRENLSIPVIANGGIFSPQSAQELRQKSGCSRIMIARGAMGNPWVFDAILKGESHIPPTIIELKNEIQLYLDAMMIHYGEELGLKVARKTVIDFLKGRGIAGEIRASISHLITQADIHPLLERIEESISPGYWQWLAHNPLADRQLRPSTLVHNT